ncbi:hypothetical protein PVL29_007056 [Vitis rotundifolia]|uniref:Uncharacterized protein n=1 Tax=Vitis rotundifolia TaxID=103349 RepID=A0AA38ZYP3_VITRO|nr:hypothetical protein PVL29_007056 [Vitis rotundifolia]
MVLLQSGSLPGANLFHPVFESYLLLTCLVHEPLPHVSPKRALLILICVPECKLMKAGLSNWQKACFMPTKSDAHIVAFRAWLRKHSAGPCPQLLPESS